MPFQTAKEAKQFLKDRGFNDISREIDCAETKPLESFSDEIIIAFANGVERENISNVMEE